MAKQSLVDTDEVPAMPPRDPDRTSISPLVEVELGALTDQGKVRTNNEDQYFVARFDRAFRPLLTNLPPVDYPGERGETGYGMLVADGMGGHVAGEVASQTAVSVLLDLVVHTPDWIMRPNDQSVAEALRRNEERFQQIQAALFEQARINRHLSGMGTTLTMAWNLGTELLVVHVGDSRAYLWRQGRLKQVTRDQTVIQEMIDAGTLSPEEAATHRLRHVLTGVLTTTDREVPAQTHRLRLLDGDQVLLCTDGLTEMVPEATLTEVLARPGSAQDACQTLIDLALQEGGRDNVTVVLARYRISARPG